MVQRARKIFVAISGGVDSSTAAALLLRQGYECSGVFMITHDRAHEAQSRAEQVCRQLGMILYVLDVRREFAAVREYFCSEYLQARTPNPCVVCNSRIKFGTVWEFARQKGADALATGHYARVMEQDGYRGLYAAEDAAKDQSYALAMINKAMLEHIILPMGDYTKQQTRQMAASMALGTAGTQESQEICFVPGNDYAAFLEQLCPGIAREGDIVDSSGRMLGRHAGIHRFTIGQRRGVKVAMGTAWYVVGLDAENNTVVLGPREQAMHRGLVARDVNWLVNEPKQPFQAKVKIRYNSKYADATVEPAGDKAVVRFDQPAWAVTPGQLAVFYLQRGCLCQVAGAGWIDNARRG